MVGADFFIFLVVIAFAIFFPVLIIGVVFFVLKRNQKNVRAWEQLAGEIGFHKPQPGKLRMEGDYNGFKTVVAVGSRSRNYGDSRRREFFTYCTTSFDNPLGFAFEIRAHENMFGSLLAKQKTKLGNPAFDDKFGAECYDESVFKRLLLSDFPAGNTQNLLGDLLLVRKEFSTIHLDDKKVYIETSGQVGDHEKLKRLLFATNRIAKRFSDAAEKFPPADWEKALYENWAIFADKYGLSFDKSRSTLTGNYQNYPISVRVYPEPGKWKTDIEVKFPRKLEIGLNVYPEVAIHSVGKLFGFQDLKTNHPAFDNEFIVRAKNPQVALRKMTPELCDQILGLKRNSEALSFDDESFKLTTGFVLGDLNVLNKFLKGVVGTMERLR